MIGRTRIAATGAGALLAVGIFTATPAGASDGVQTDATVQAQTDLVSQTVDLVNQACLDATRVADGAVATLSSSKGITLSSQQAGTGLNLAVSLPALTESLPVLGSLPLLGSVSGQLDADPLKVSCATSADGTALGVSAAGVEALASAVAPGLDVSGILADITAAVPDAGASASAGIAGAPATSLTATAAPAGSAAASTRAGVLSPAVRASAATQPQTSVAAATPASSSTGLVDQTVGSPGALARTGAGVGALGLLGTALFGSGRLVAFGRRFLKIG